jgi:hypothetical protein
MSFLRLRIYVKVCILPKLFSNSNDIWIWNFAHIIMPKICTQKKYALRIVEHAVLLTALVIHIVECFNMKAWKLESNFYLIFFVCSDENSKAGDIMCEKHDGTVSTWYCVEHAKVFCKTCMEKEHRYLSIYVNIRLISLCLFF